MTINQYFIRATALLLVLSILHAEDYKRLGDIVFEDEVLSSYQPKPTSQPKYLLPNEGCPWFFMEGMPASQDTLLSVGTFRTLVSFAQGRFNRLLAIDYEKQAVLFNRAHLDLIRTIADLYPEQISHQRYQYQAAISGRWLTEAGLLELDSMGDEGKKAELVAWSAYFTNDAEARASRETILKYLKKNPKKYRKTLGQTESKNDDKSAKAFSKRLAREHRTYIEFSSNFTEGPEDLAALEQDLRAQASRETLKTRMIFIKSFAKGDIPYYWEDDEQWQHITDALRDDRIVVIRADLRNPADFEQINQGLDSVNAHVSVIDISNAGSNEYGEPEPLIETISSLRKADDARLWLTFKEGPKTQESPDEKGLLGQSCPIRTGLGYNWQYYSFDANDPDAVRNAVGK